MFFRSDLISDLMSQLLTMINTILIKFYVFVKDVVLNNILLRFATLGLHHRPFDMVVEVLTTDENICDPPNNESTP